MLLTLYHILTPLILIKIRRIKIHTTALIALKPLFRRRSHIRKVITILSSPFIIIIKIRNLHSFFTRLLKPLSKPSFLIIIAIIIIIFLQLNIQRLLLLHFFLLYAINRLEKRVLLLLLKKQILLPHLQGPIMLSFNRLIMAKIIITILIFKSV